MKIENINGFIWAVLEYDDAIRRFTNDEDIYILFDNGVRELIFNLDEFGHIKLRGLQVGIEIGAKEELQADYERNNDNRTFEDWCLSKIE